MEINIPYILTQINMFLLDIIVGIYPYKRTYWIDIFCNMKQNLCIKGMVICKVDISLLWDLHMFQEGMNYNKSHHKNNLNDRLNRNIYQNMFSKGHNTDYNSLKYPNNIN